MDLPIDAIRRCSADAAFRAAMRDLFARLDETIAGHNPVCTNRGLCCHFDAFGHRLYVTSAELAYFLAHAAGPLRAGPDPGSCPYQIDGFCTAREQRPAGCRIFFCDPAARHWQSPLTEQTLRLLRDLHERFDLPYAYVEWRSALKVLGVAPAP
jgi:hypothetical protein